MHWVLGLALAAAVFVVLKHWGALTPGQKKGAVWKVVLVVGAALLLFMVLTGRVHVLTAAVAAVIPLLRKLPSLLKFLPMLRNHLGGGRPNSEKASADDTHQQSREPHRQSALSEKEACDVLGVEPSCSAEEVIAAHRRLIQKLHPDRGGNDYLAAKINDAKAVLLQSRKG